MDGVKRYYSSLETRLGNWIVYGGRAHLGYYPPDVWWPFPVHHALIAMEDQVFRSLRLSPGARVLDAGCGDGQVAIHFAQKGLQVHAIDILPEHVQQAQQNVREAIDKVDWNAKHNSDTVTPLDALTVQQGDYHDLQTEESGSLDGIYTIETLVHATDLNRVLSEFYRVLKPGGRIALYEYDHWGDDDIQQTNQSEKEAMDKVRLHGAISKTANELTRSLSEDRSEHVCSQKGLAGMLNKAGFEDVQERDISPNVNPMIRFLAYFLYVPSMIVLTLGLEAYFINTVAIVTNYQRGWKYIAVTARKPATVSG
ncbi:S-adenosyl-L-methionine-dependent methyltransferase [Aspergillus minisclerotigenes]|uniref:S-adenosyl-L-methionine-dependent methyltransferase n=1 Tax=Aspergillus minisclerotigenes TaxID=656917 RepID=A0A5N6J171_9EURO|nr:S-adenosyl-L-methionine-dependent methyltransferase [Aspergillus minisclerotigenes]